MGGVILDKVFNPPMRKQLEETFTKYMGNAPIYGNVFYVHGTDGSSTSSGKNINSPINSLDNAINNASANNGDVIFLLPGHTETYTTTGAKFIVDKAGLTIIGVGEGADRPTISYGHTGTTGTISAASCVIANVLFLTAIDQVVTYATISGTDCKLIDCEGRDVTDKEVVTDFTCTGDRPTFYGYFKNGYCNGVAGDANDVVFHMVGVDNALIKACRFLTKSLTAVIEFETTACNNVIIDDCVFYVNGTSLTKNIVDTVGTSTWIARNCFDVSTGGAFSGGSGNTLAGDDLSAVTDALYGANGIATFPNGAVPANNVSIAEVLRDIWDSLRNGTGGSEPETNTSIVDILSGANGIVTFPAAANPGNGVSIAEVLRDAWDNIGDAKARTNLQNLVDMLGNPDVAAQSIWDCLAGAGGIATFPAGAAAANDVSLAEVLRYVQENIIVGTGTALPNNQSLYDILAGANGIATFPASAAPANDVSLAEVLRDIWDVLRNGTGGTEPGTNLSLIDEFKRCCVHYENPNYISVTADMTSATWNTIATHEVLTITGLVRVYMIAECVGDITDGASGGTLEFGNEDDTDLWISTTTGTDIDNGELWVDATPTEVDAASTSIIFDRTINGKDLGYEIKTGALTGGSIVFHIWWIPLNSTGAAVAGDGSALI